MGIWDNLRMATGVALEPTEAYKRAYEKGVLLGPAHFATAVTLFQTAAEKLKAVNPGMAWRALANASIYRFFVHRDPADAERAVQALQQVQQIEAPGTVDEIVDASKLRAELYARSLEERARLVAGAPSQRAEAYRRAAQAWKPLFEWRPITYELLADDHFTEDGLTRFFFNAAQAVLNDAFGAAASNPDLAAEYLAVAVQAFARCGANELRKSTREKLHAIRVERSCWFCGRRARGLGENIRLLSATPSEYFARLARADRDRGDAYERATGGIYACTPCATAIDGIAEHRACEVRDELNKVVAQMNSNVQALHLRVTRLESR